jgi:CheY-like chemotaxis protein
MRILIVDDDADIRETLRLFLEDEDYDIIQAADGVEAIERAQAADAPLVVLLDFMMPRLDGMDVLRRAAQDPLLSRHAYIIMTALHRAPSADFSLLSQQLLIAHTEKPFDLTQLAATIAQQCARLAAVMPSTSPPDASA